ncbi:unnamed protein product [Leptidea sinapis]|uniref:Cathepsin propeptide inhibitor domain-containing protein n=1 Tax=Leptidea sinapis TaxID=189913 RepID=A0A5E4Q659_9NEOP|nr:unnamed protein product [Leptidea sinapis]
MLRCTLGVLLLLVGLACTKDINKPKYDIRDAQILFEKFQKDYERQYDSEDDKNIHYNAFVRNLKKIITLNQQEPEAFVINKYADYTKHEMKKLFGPMPHHPPGLLPPHPPGFWPPHHPPGLWPPHPPGVVPPYPPGLWPPHPPGLLPEHSPGLIPQDPSELYPLTENGDQYHTGLLPQHPPGLLPPHPPGLWPTDHPPGLWPPHPPGVIPPYPPGLWPPHPPGIITETISLYVIKTSNFDIYLCNVFNLRDVELLLNPELMQEVTAEYQGVAGRVHRVNPARRDKECVASLKLK